MPARPNPWPVRGVVSPTTSFVGMVDPPDPIRGEDGIWRYGDTGVAVPGATDRTVADVVDFLVGVRKDEQRDCVFIARSEVEAHPALSWVVEVGQLLRGKTKSADVFRVPWDIWQERGGEPVGMSAPERDTSGLSRLMVTEERDVRLLRRAIELRSEQRTRWVLLATRFGMKRREIGELLGLSSARVQQLADDAPEHVKLEVGDIVEDAFHVLRFVGPRTQSRASVELPSARDVGFVDDLMALGLLEADGDEPEQVRVSDEGRRVELHLLEQQAKGSAGRGR